MDSLGLLVVVVIAFGLLVFGHIKKMGLFNVLSAPLFLFLAFQFTEDLLLLIPLVVLAIFEVWYGFLGDHK